LAGHPKGFAAERSAVPVQHDCVKYYPTGGPDWLDAPDAVVVSHMKITCTFIVPVTCVAGLLSDIGAYPGCRRRTLRNAFTITAPVTITSKSHLRRRRHLP
jgi:hypothetical protein